MHFNYLELQASLSFCPTLNLGWLRAGILIALPLRGSRPVLAATLLTLKLPKPINDISLPLLMASITELVNMSIVFSASV